LIFICISTSIGVRLGGFGLNDEERQWIDKLIHKTGCIIFNRAAMFDIWPAQVTIPNEWEKLAPVNIGVTAGIETTKVAPQWIEKSQIADGHIITVVSEHSKNRFYEFTTYQAHNGETGEMIPNL
jgi:uncharacterized protein YbdZ (MbtH family)